MFGLEQPDGAWRVAGRLPRPLGYGVSLSTKDGVVCLGGSDARRHYAEVFLLRWERGEIKVSPRPPLPKPCANFCGALLGDTIYVAGGIETPGSTNALKTFWSLELRSAQAQWRELAPAASQPRRPPRNAERETNPDWGRRTAGDAPEPIHPIQGRRGQT